MFFGVYQCADAFLYIFTILPLRFLFSIYKLLRLLNPVTKYVMGWVWVWSWSCIRPLGGDYRLTFTFRYREMLPVQMCDFLKVSILALNYLVIQHIDVSMMYHLIKGQAIIKLYIFFSMLEVVTPYT